NRDAAGLPLALRRYRRVSYPASVVRWSPRSRSKGMDRRREMQYSARVPIRAKKPTRHMREPRTFQEPSCRPLPDRVFPVDLHPGTPLHAAIWPPDLHVFNHGRIAETKMDAHIARRDVTIRASNLIDLSQTARRDGNSSANCVAITFRTHELEAHPSS